MTCGGYCDTVRLLSNIEDRVLSWGLSTTTDWPSIFLSKFSALIIFSTYTYTLNLDPPALKMINRLSYLGRIVFYYKTKYSSGRWLAINE